MMRGMLHRPPGFSSAQRYPAVVMCHGFTGSRVEPHRIFVKTARQLASQGIVTVRCDFWGSGESDGEFVDVTPETEIEDALAIIEWLRAQAGIDRTRLGLLGFSLGGLVASCTAARAEQIKALCLWGATAHMGRRMRERTTPEATSFLEEHGYVDLSGNQVGRAFFDVALKTDPLKEVKKFSGAALVVHGTEDVSVPVSEAYEYIDALKKREPKLHLIEGADHTFNRMDWEADVIETTKQWFKANL
jgi:dipeptidyl aminopeptidase/acylaminoacyl peptidase